MTRPHDAPLHRAAAALAALVLAIGLVACGGGAGPGAAAAGEPVQLALNWFPEAEHGGFYTALEEGYYRDEGLAVEILKGGPAAPVIQQVATGQVAFGVTNADNLLLGRAQGANLKALMAPIQISPRCVMVHAASGITELAGLRDLTLAVSTGQVFFQWMRKKLPLPGVNVVPYPGNVAQFLVDPHYAQQAYVFSEPFVARGQGGDPRPLLLADLGFNPYASLLMAADDLVAKRPELAGKMVRASVRGWERYLADPASAHRHIHAINPEMTPEILDFGAKELVPLCLDPVARREGIGHMTRERWDTLAAQLVEAGAVPAGVLDGAKAFDASFLPRPAGGVGP